MGDPLTELGNRRILDGHLEQLVNLTIRSQTDLLCLLIDVDNFKHLNDQLGRAAGDELLVFLASLIRDDDLAVRMGGDEFVVLMPGATVPRGRQFTESLRQLFLQQIKAMHPTGPLVNLPMGAASLAGDHCPTGAALLSLAEKCPNRHGSVQSEPRSA